MSKCEMDDRGKPGRVKETINGFVRSVWFEPGYDHWTNRCGAGHGRHGMQLRFVLQGEEGAVQFLMYTDWVPGSVSSIGDVNSGGKTMAADLGCHWIRPWYVGQERMTEGDCDYLPGGPCYYDGSGLNAGPVMALFFEQGPEAMWERLEQEYVEVAKEAKELAET